MAMKAEACLFHCLRRSYLLPLLSMSNILAYEAFILCSYHITLTLSHRGMHTEEYSVNRINGKECLAVCVCVVMAGCVLLYLPVLAIILSYYMF